MLEEMLEFLQLCPQLAGLHFSPDLSLEEGEACLYDRGAVEQQLYWDGSRRLLRHFSLELQLPAATESERLAANKCLESVAKWLRNMDERERLPALDPGQRALSLICENGELGVLSADGLSAACQIQLQLCYLERGDGRAS